MVPEQPAVWPSSACGATQACRKDTVRSEYAGHAHRLHGARFFRDIAQNRILRGVFQDLEQWITAIGEYIDGHNQNPKPFIWTAKASDILEKITRARAVLNK